MKQIITFLLLLASFFTKAQITFDYAPLYDIEKISTTDLGEKYINTMSGYPTSYGDTFFIYNTDWSIYKSIILSHGQRYYSAASDKLFNNDALMEFLTTEYSFTGNGNVLRVINELGQVQFTFPDTVQNVEIYKIGNAFKLKYDYGNNQGYHKVFSLPGTLPCNPCSFSTGMVEPTSGGFGAGLTAYPNPFNQTLTFEYNLLQKEDARLVLTGVDGRELKNLPLINQSDKLTLSTSDLPNGIIIASLYGKNQHLISKKLLKIE